MNVLEDIVAEKRKEIDSARRARPSEALLESLVHLPCGFRPALAVPGCE